MIKPTSDTDYRINSFDTDYMMLRLPAFPSGRNLNDYIAYEGTKM